MLKKLYKKTLLFITPLLLVAPFFVSAQIIPDFGSTLLLTITPTYPSPEEGVTVSIESFSADLHNSNISWFLDTKLVQEAVGITSFTFTAGALGSPTRIDVVAQEPGAPLLSETVYVRPTDMDILWQGDTFTHPLYRGKRLPTTGSAINVEVIPHFINEFGRKFATSELTYVWSVEGKKLTHASGRGENTITITQNKPIKNIPIEIEVASPDGLITRKESLQIPIETSALHIYENNPLLGILFNKAVNSLYSLVGQETNFIAYPFFMSAVDRNDSSLQYSWSLDGKPITLGEDTGSITVSHEGGVRGTALIKVGARNTKEIFQKSDVEFSIEFGNSPSSGFSF
ncbi:MAG: hypothetical protein WD509_01250 [Candidatus Paceibacterota bacterium]